MAARNPQLILLSPSKLTPTLQKWAEQMGDIIRKSGGEVEVADWSGADPGESLVQKDFIIILITQELMEALKKEPNRIKWFEKKLKSRKIHKDQILRLVLSGRSDLMDFPGKFGSLSALPMESLLEPVDAVEIILKELNQRIRILGKTSSGSQNKEKKGFANSLKDFLGGGRSRVEWEKIRPFVISHPNTLKISDFGTTSKQNPFDLE